MYVPDEVNNMISKQAGGWGGGEVVGMKIK